MRLPLLSFAALLGCIAMSTGCNNSTDAPATAASAETPSILETGNVLRDRLDRVYDRACDRRIMSTGDQAAWQVVHGLLSYGKDLKLSHKGQVVPALDYLLKGGELKGWNLRKGDHGLEAILEAGSKTGQGHEDQWLGYLSLCGLPIDSEIVVAGHTYTVRDLITQAQWDIYPGMEATWTLMGFTNYLPMDAKWSAKDGQEWTIERMAEMEAKADVVGAACGGTHRLFALAAALNRHIEEGGEVTGGWAAAQKTVRDFVNKAREYQQPDGSFSTLYFQRPGTDDDISERIGCTGHTLEFLTVALNDDELKAPWVSRAVKFLLDAMEATEDYDLECGKLYHSTHALQLYRERLFGPRQPVAQTAEK